MVDASPTFLKTIVKMLVSTIDFETVTQNFSYRLLNQRTRHALVAEQLGCSQQKSAESHWAVVVGAFFQSAELH